MSAAYQCLRSLSRHCPRLQRQPHYVAFEVGISGAHLSKAHHRHSSREQQRCLHGVIIPSQRATININLSRTTYHSSRSNSSGSSLSQSGTADNRSVQANSAAAGFASNADDGDEASSWPSPASQHQQVEQQEDSPAVYRQDWQRWGTVGVHR